MVTEPSFQNGPNWDEKTSSMSAQHEDKNEILNLTGILSLHLLSERKWACFHFHSVEPLSRYYHTCLMVLNRDVNNKNVLKTVQTRLQRSRSPLVSPPCSSDQRLHMFPCRLALVFQCTHVRNLLVPAFCSSSRIVAAPVFCARGRD